MARNRNRNSRDNNSGIDGITNIVGDIGEANIAIQNTFGNTLFGGYGGQQNTNKQRINNAKTDYTVNKYENLAERDDNKTRVDYAKTDYFEARYGRLTTKEQVDEINYLENGGINGRNMGGNANQTFPKYSSNIPPRDRIIAQGYNNAYNQPSAPYNNIDGFLTAQETRRGLDNSGLTSNPAALQDFANDLQAITGRNLTYVKNGQTMLSMDNVAAALTEYARRNPQINLAALERGDPNAWQALDAFLDSDAQRFGRGAGNTIASAPVQDPSLPNQIPAPTITYAPDEKIADRIGMLLAEELEQVRVKARQEGKTKLEADKLAADKAQEMSNQITAALQAKGIKVVGNPIDELSGYIAAEKPKLAAILRNENTPTAEAAKALRQATGELQTEATRALTIAQINGSQVPAQNGQANNQNVVNQAVNNNVSNPAQEERMLLASLERGESIDKVSDIKKHLNDLLKLKGEQRFKEDDNVNEPRFIATLNQTLKQNLDPRTYNDTLNGGAFTVKGTLELIERNMGNRADVERNRARFEEGFKDGASEQVILYGMNKEQRVELMQNLHTLGYKGDAKTGFSADDRLTAYLSDKLYNQGNFRTAPKSVQDFIKDVEAGNYKDGFPLTDPSNASQMREVMDYVQKSVNLDLAKKANGLPVGVANVNSSTVAAVANNITPQQEQATQPATTTPTAPALGDGGATHYESTLGTVVDSSRWAENMFETSKENEKQRLIRDIVTASRNNNPEFVNFHKDFVAKNKAAIDAEIKRQNERNDVALQNLAEEQKANKVSDVKVPEQKSEVSKNPPSITVPQTPTPQKPATPTNNNAEAKIAENINKLLPNIPKKDLENVEAKLPDFLKANNIVTTGDKAKDLAAYLQKNEPKIAAELAKENPDINKIGGDLMKLVEKIQQTAPAAPTLLEEEMNRNSVIVNNNSMMRALQQAQGTLPSTVTGGKEANGVQLAGVPNNRTNAAGIGVL